MQAVPQLLVIGTADTKADELLFIRQCIEAQGGQVRIMDVGVLGKPRFTPELSNDEVAQAAGTTRAAIAALGDENEAMKQMADGAVKLTLNLYTQGLVHGVLVLGGTMGTDLALDVTGALPLGMPKFVVSTVAYSHLIPPHRLAPDLMMVLWAGGLYGLNSVCQSILSQAAGALVGACKAVIPANSWRPRVAISSLGKSCLSYMVQLKPALEARGYEPVVFHCIGMGGQAMETLIAQGAFVAVFDFALGEVANEFHGSVAHGGPHRLHTAGRLGVPQIVAPGATDMIDLQTWAGVPAKYEGRPYHAHNRLIASVISNTDERRELAQFIAGKLNRAQGPTAFLLPQRGIQAWDREGQDLHDPEGHAVYVAEFRKQIKAPVQLIDLDLHINDPAFTDRALALFDQWVADGLIPAGVSTPA